LTVELWQQLRAAPLWVFPLFGTVALLFLVFGSWLAWSILRPSPKRQPRSGDQLVNEDSIHARIASANETGIDISAAKGELAELTRRRSEGIVYLALYGEISSGKSSLIGALLPSASVETGVVGGTTTSIQQYRWRRDSGDQVVLIDVPGLNQVGRDYNQLAAEEAQRAHVVIFVLDGDMTRDQHAALEPLLALNKPVILALNKLDRYPEADQSRLRTQLEGKFSDNPRVSVVSIATRPVQRLMVVDAEGREHETVRTASPQIDDLRNRVQEILDNNLELLEELRDTAVFELASQKLERAKAEHRITESRELVNKYTRRAVVGGMAAVGPGTDIIIQGYLGTRLVKSLCELYEAPVREIEIEKLFSMTQQQIRKTLPLILAIVGNAAKAFPGVGTLAGGLIHAVAYGLIFDTLGRAVIQTLETRGELRPAPASLLFKEKLGEDLETRAKSLAKMALQARDYEHSGS
jgi:GTPase Era involved in 16S rRNA processing